MYLASLSLDFLTASCPRFPLLEVVLSLVPPSPHKPDLPRSLFFYFCESPASVEASEAFRPCPDLGFRCFHAFSTMSEDAPRKRSRFDQTEPEPRKPSRFDRRSRSPSSRHTDSRRSRSPLGKSSQSPASGGKSTTGLDPAAAAGKSRDLWPS